jgi:NADH-quinone oxidoreductase subunit B
LAEPKYVIATGGCAVSGGPFRKSYHVLKGVGEIIPVDVYVPGCPPRPEAMIYGIMQLSRKMRVERFFGGVNRQESREDFLRNHPIDEE